MSWSGGDGWDGCAECASLERQMDRLEEQHDQEMQRMDNKYHAALEHIKDLEKELEELRYMRESLEK